MKILLALSTLFTTTLAFAGAPVSYATVSGTITTSAYTELVSGTPQAASSIMVANTGSSFLIIAQGASGAETNTGFVIPPSGGPILIPMVIVKGARLSLKALHNNNVGVTGVVFFQ